MALYTGFMRLLALLLALSLAHASQAARIGEARPLMGTVVEITAEGPDARALRAAAAAAFAEMKRLTDMMSHYDPASAVSAVNAAAGKRPVPVPAELAEVLAQARQLSERTGGAFDVTKKDYHKLRSDARTAFLAEPGLTIDLGGIAKLYILEAGRRVLEARGVARALVNGGGDVVAHSDGAPWRVGVRDPRAPSQLLGAVLLERGAVASSGDYERLHHIIDPRTGQPSQGARGVTLVGPSAESVNGLGVAIMVLSAAAGQALIADAPGVEGLIVDRDGALWMSPGLGARWIAPR
jgi:FAD:protein FMN transferase